jgi:hypothetical protein
MRSALTGFAAAFCLAGVAAGAEVNEGWIKEGVGVAGVRLGMTAEAVRKKLGEPFESNEVASGAVIFMSYHSDDNFGVYFDDDERVRLVIASIERGSVCTKYDACLYRESDLAKIKSRHGEKLLRFVDRDGSVTFRLLTRYKGRPVLTEYTPVEERDGVVQVAITWWDRPIDASGLD